MFFIIIKTEINKCSQLLGPIRTLPTIETKRTRPVALLSRENSSLAPARVSQSPPQHPAPHPTEWESWWTFCVPRALGLVAPMTPIARLQSGLGERGWWSQILGGRGSDGSEARLPLTNRLPRGSRTPCQRLSCVFENKNETLTEVPHLYPSGLLTVVTPFHESG